MPDLDCQIVLAGPSGLPKDRFVNTLHFSGSAPLQTWDELADGIMPDLVDLVEALEIYPSWLARPFEVKAYNPDEPKPREPKIYQGTLPGGATVDGMPPEVALCLSYYTDRNLPRKRGRIYLGPLRRTAGTERPLGNESGGIIGQLLSFGQALSDLGGVDVDWQHVSTVTGERRRIEHIWVDNAWDTQRRRGLARTNRYEQDTSG